MRPASSAAPAALPEQPKEERKRGREEEKQRKREDDKRQKQLGEIEKEIARTESEIARLEAEMGQPGFFDDLERGAAAGERHAPLNEQLEKLYGEWEELVRIKSDNAVRNKRHRKSRPGHRTWPVLVTRMNWMLCSTPRSDSRIHRYSPAPCASA